MVSDRYTYANSAVLINKLGITDYRDWRQTESDFVGVRMGHLARHPIAGPSTSHTSAEYMPISSRTCTPGAAIFARPTHTPPEPPFPTVALDSSVLKPGGSLGNSPTRAISRVLTRTSSQIDWHSSGAR